MAKIPTFTKTNARNSFKVLLWSTSSAVLGAIAVWLVDAPVSEQYIFLIPVVNTLLYTLKEWFDKKVEV